MAKVTNPLQSSEASGQIGKAMVHFRWKGIHAVRSYVVPANPKTEDQMIIRGYFSTCVDKWHDILMNAQDKLAWRRWAEVLRRPMTNMNAFISARMTELAKGRTWGDTWNMHDLVPAPSQFTFSMKAPELFALRCEYGLSLTYRPNVQNGVWNGVSNEWDFTVTGLAENTNYFFRCYTAYEGKYGYTGVYLTKTTD